MNIPEGCPYCQSRDIRTIAPSDVDLSGYRCHECQRVFYVADVTLRAEPAAIAMTPADKPTPKKRKPPK